MLNQCTSTPESIAESLLAGDLILNLTGFHLHFGCGIRCLRFDCGEFTISDSVNGQCRWSDALADALVAFGKQCPDRVVVVVDESFSALDELTSLLGHSGLAHQVCMLQSSCDADAFMDEADTEAVTERLRQLGYI